MTKVVAQDQVLSGARPLGQSSGSGRRRRRRDRTRSDSSAMVSVVYGLLAAAVVGSMLAVGTVHPSVLLFVAPLVLAAGVVAIHLAAKEDGRRLAPAAAVLLGLCAYCLLQACPLPARVTALIAPRNMELWSGALSLSGDGTPALLPISLDPGASLIEALKWGAYAATFQAAAFVARHKGKAAIPMLLFASGLTAALVSMAHRAAGLDSLYGLYQPKFVAPGSLIGPLLNPNNLAGYLNLCAFCGIGLAVTRKPILPGWVLGWLAFALFLWSAFLASRGALASVVFGVLLLPMVLRKRTKARRAFRFAPYAAVAFLGLSVSLVTANTRVSHALFGEGYDKLSLISWSPPLLRDHLFFGIGRGAFETVFPAYRQDLGNSLYQHAECFPVQWCAEWGLPVALVAMGALGWFLRPSKLGTAQSALSVVCTVGVGVLLVQNLLDLALEVPSVCIALFALLGSLWSVASTEPPGAEPSAPHIMFTPAFALAATFLVVVAAVAGLPSSIADRANISAALSRPSANGDAEMALVQSALLRHPADPYIPLAGAVVAQRRGESPFPWIGRAIERDPNSARPHLLLAQVLARRGAVAQTLLATRMAAEREWALVGAASKIALSVSRDASRLAEAAPEGAAGSALLVSFAGAFQPPTRGWLLDEAIRRDVTYSSALIARADELAYALENNAPHCHGTDEPRCRKRLQEVIATLEKLPSEKAAVSEYRARLQLLTGNVDGAERSLRDCYTSKCLQLLVIVAEKLGDLHRARDIGWAYLDVGCKTQAGCEAAGLWLASRWNARGDAIGALRVLERAARESGSVTAWRHALLAAAKAGQEVAERNASQNFTRLGGRIDQQLEQDLMQARQGSRSMVSP